MEMEKAREASSGAAVRVFYDGSCPLCSKEIALYQRLDSAQKVAWCDVSSPEQAPLLPLPQSVLMARFHVQPIPGDPISGARAFLELWRHIPGWRWLSVLRHVPGVPSMLELAYVMFLKIRPAIQCRLK
ncbi:MAG: thiol-disulfide oxidoreductase DCC family protein [Burkholderiaceae bacterium]